MQIFSRTESIVISRKSPATRGDDAFGAEIWFKGARDHDNASYCFLRGFFIVLIQNDRAAKNHNWVGGRVIHTDKVSIGQPPLDQLIVYYLHSESKETVRDW